MNRLINQGEALIIVGWGIVGQNREQKEKEATPQPRSKIKMSA